MVAEGIAGVVAPIAAAVHAEDIHREAWGAAAQAAGAPRDIPEVAGRVAARTVVSAGGTVGATGAAPRAHDQGTPSPVPPFEIEVTVRAGAVDTPVSRAEAAPDTQDLVLRCGAAVTIRAVQAGVSPPYAADTADPRARVMAPR